MLEGTLERTREIVEKSKAFFNKACTHRDGKAISVYSAILFARLYTGRRQRRLQDTQTWNHRKTTHIQHILDVRPVCVHSDYPELQSNFFRQRI